MSWYISLTLKWEDLLGESKSKFLDEIEEAVLPSSHIRIPRGRMHSTLFAFAEIEKPFHPHDNFHDSARYVLDQLRGAGLCQILSQINKFSVEPIELRHYDSGSTIQFEASEAIEEIRKNITESLKEINIEAYPPDVQFPFDGGYKNKGSRLWGSIARNPSPVQPDNLNQKVDLRSWEISTLQAEHAILAISDEALTNHFEEGDYCRIEFI